MNMGHETDMPAAVIDEFELDTMAYIGDDETFGEELLKRVERQVQPATDSADVVFIDDYMDSPEDIIPACFERVNQGGFLMGSKFDHQHLDVQRAVAVCFNLMHVQTGPAGVWCVRK